MIKQVLLESLNIDEVFKQTGSEILFLLDIDNCILVAEQPSGRDEWWQYQVDKLQAEGWPVAKAEAAASELFNRAQHTASNVLVDQQQNLPALIASALNQGHTVYGITARNYKIAQLTHRQLQQFNILFSGNKHNLTHTIEQKDVLLQDGILFCNDINKATCLQTFESALAKPLKDYQKLVFVDDKWQNCQRLHQFCQQQQLNSAIYHYRYVEHYRPFTDEMRSEAAEFA
jgi:hypothetical protein